MPRNESRATQDARLYSIHSGAGLGSLLGPHAQSRTSYKTHSKPGLLKSRLNLAGQQHLSVGPGSQEAHEGCWSSA